MNVGGKGWTRNYLDHSDLVAGKDIVFKMSEKPVLSRGTAASDRPYSFSGN